MFKTNVSTRRPVTLWAQVCLERVKILSKHVVLRNHCSAVTTETSQAKNHAKIVHRSIKGRDRGGNNDDDDDNVPNNISILAMFPLFLVGWGFKIRF